ncbi:hypothetical protein CJD36_012145 [Flavipsychrobacter stenotrophus]|uniref:DarT domain-containing protein n=1 Tax=Flavipsychrobacter stenotrophus TaxID=2077091 RepID=A0A2S7SW07_9BACT|nr:DUF4433 domain-containing protein [Flavipsychrobacter stenotrophus]PQJ10716.1 hypothetical protein CJD36_012145 [Flavipsychrobacter stenotrophus]
MQKLVINRKREYCYRICHIRNLTHVLVNGLCTKHHPKADPNFISIGNPGIISVRDDRAVLINDYGNIGEYVPFYFTPLSIMQYNIVTGYWDPPVAKIHPEDLLIIQCKISDLVEVGRFFFTDGQANSAVTKHYTDLNMLKEIDWDCIQQQNFSKSGDDYDRPRRYQAEFLVHNHVPVTSINALFVYNEKAATFVRKEMVNTGNNTLKVNIENRLYFPQ